MSTRPRYLHTSGSFILCFAVLCAGCAAAEGGDEGSVSPKSKALPDGGGPETALSEPDAGLGLPPPDGESGAAADDTAASDTGDPDTGDPDTGDPDTGDPDTGDPASDPPDTDPGPPPPDPGDGGDPGGSCTSDGDCPAPLDCCDTSTGSCGIKVFGFCVAP